MAEGKDRIIIDVLGNTKPLEREIAKVTNKSIVLNSKGFSQPLGKITGQLGEFEKSLAASNARVIAFGASAGAIFAVQKAFQETIKSVIEVQKALTDINVILNVNEASLKGFGNALFDIAKNTGVSFSEVTKAAVEFSRQGLNVEDTLKRTSDALILTRLSGLDTVSSVEAITAALNSFNKTTLTSNDLVNKLAAVDAAFAVSSGDLAEAVKRVGSSAQDAGVSLDQLIALVTSAQQITARGGAVIGNSFKTIFTRLQRPKVLDDLEQLGIVTRDQQGNVLPLIQVLSNLAKTYETLSGSQKSSIAETVGGVFQINILKASLSDLTKEYSIYKNALDISNSASDEANSRNEALNKTISATINTTLVNLQKAATEVGNLAFAPALERALGGLNVILENFGSSKDSETIGSKIGEGLLRGIGNFLSGPGLLLGAATLFKIFERLTVFSADAFKTIAGLNSQTANQQALQSQILNLISKNPQIIEQINKGNIDTASLHNSILSLIQQETIAMEKQVAVAASLAQTLSATGVMVATSGALKGATVAKNKSLGFIPNFSANQEIMGALSGGYAPGKIKQTFIPNHGRVTYNDAEKLKTFQGMSQPAIMPPLDSEAGKNYKKNFESVHGFDPYASTGFVPNFISKPAEKLKNLIGNQGVNSKIIAAFRNKSINQEEFNYLNAEMQRNKKGPNAAKRKIIPAPDVTVISSFGGGQSSVDYKDENNENVRFTDIKSAVPRKLIPSDEGKFDQIIKNHLPDAIRGMASELLGNVNKGFPDDAKIFAQMQSDTSAYPQIAGRIFESVISAAINKNIDPKEEGNRTWDYSPKDFDDKEILDALFGSDVKKLKNKYIDAKRSPVGSGSTNSSLKSKLFTTFNNQIKTTKAMANGFIPNFSPVEKAFSAEKSLGGDPTLDFQPGFGLYVRDKKTQPNFQSVKKDHPEGLQKAMKNSSMIQQGLASFGFVPNFATTSGFGAAASTYSSKEELSGSLAASKRILDSAAATDVAMKKLIIETQTTTSQLSLFGRLFSDSKLPTGVKNFKNKLGFATLGLDIAGGFLSSAFSDNKAISKNIDGFTQGLSTASTALLLIPGPVGIGVGAFIALSSAASSLAKMLKQNGQDLGPALEEAKQNLSDFSSASQKYAETLQKINEGYKSGLSQNEIIKLNERLIDAATDLPDKYRLQLAGITDINDLQTEISKVGSDLVKEEKNLAFATAYRSKILSEAFTTPEVFNTKSEMEQATKQIINGFSSFGKDLFVKNINSEAENILGLSNEKFIDYLQKVYEENTDIANTLKLANPREIEAFKFSIVNYGKSLADLNEVSIASDTLKQEQAKKEKELQANVDRAKNALDGFNESLNTFINSAIRSSVFKDTFEGAQKANSRDVNLSKASGLLDINSQFSSQESITRVKSQLESLKRNEDYLQNVRQTFAESKIGFLNIGTELIQALQNPTENKEPVNKTIVEDFRNTILDLSRKNLSPENLAKGISDAVGSIGMPAEDTQKIQFKISDQLQTQQEKLLTLNENQKKANEIAQNSLSVEQQLLKTQRDIKTFGGIESFISGQKDTFENLNKSLDLFASNRDKGNSKKAVIERGRGAAGLLSETLNLVGGGINEKLLKNLGGLTGAAIQGRSKDIRSTALSYANSDKLRGTGLQEVFRDIANRSGEIAKTQVENLVKRKAADEKIGENVDSIFQLLNGVFQGQQSEKTQLDLNTNIKSAIDSLNTNIAPKLESLRNSIENASRIYDAQLKYQEVGNQLSKSQSQTQYSGIRTGQIEQQQKDLTGELSKANLFQPVKDILIEEVQKSMQAGKRINLDEISNLRKDISPPMAQQLGELKNNKVITPIIDQLNRNMTTSKTLQAQTPQYSKKTDELTINAQMLASKLKELGGNVTPLEGALGGQKTTIDGSVNLNIPDPNIAFNVGGAIDVNPVTFNVVFDANNSDLTSLVTPIAENVAKNIQSVAQTQFEKDIQKMKEDIGNLYNSTGATRLPPKR